MKTWKKLSVFLISTIACLFIGMAIDLACAGGDDDPYDYYVSFFHNNLQGGHNYGAFYLSGNYLFSEDEPASEAAINSAEWAAYLGDSVIPADVERAMYHLGDRADSIMLARRQIGSTQLPDSLKANTFLRALALSRHNNALQYYTFAKSVEHNANYAYDYWNPKPIDTPALNRCGTLALQKGKAEQDKFLKLRYLYQAQRLLHYSGNYKMAMAIYDQQVYNLSSGSYIKGMALSLKAGELRRLHDTLRAAYLFSKVFSQYPERRVQAYKDFHFCSVQVASVAALAKNNSEKAVIYAIDGFGNPDLNLLHLQKVYAYAPSSEMVGVLLVREINKLEVSYLTPQLNSRLTYNYPFDPVHGADSAAMQLAHLRKLQAFCDQLAAGREYPEPAIGYLASAYLAWMAGDDAQGFATLAKLDHQKFNKKFTDQQQLIRLLLQEQKIQKFNTINENQLLPLLNWLKVRAAQKPDISRPGDSNYYDWSRYDGNKFAASSRDFYNLVLSPAYLQQHDTLKAALCMQKGENFDNVTPNGFWQNYLHAAQMEQIIAWKKQPVKDPYLKFLADDLHYISDAFLYDLLGTAYLREHNYPAAVKALSHVKPENFGLEEGEIADPFISQIPDYPKIFMHANSKGYTKLLFAKDMVILQQKLAADPKNAPVYYYKIATGLYNASTYGNAYYLISYGWSAEDYGRVGRYSYDRDYIQCTSAEQYYLKARSASSSADFKAKCTFMAAKCRQKQLVWPNDYDASLTDYNLAVRQNPYFKELKNDYANTGYYKLAVSECSYLRDFLKK